MYGQLGHGNNNNVTIWTQEVLADTDWVAVQCGAQFTLAVKRDGSLYATGNNWWGQLGLGDEINRNTFTKISDDWQAVAKYFSGGSAHSAATYIDETLYTSGESSSGQLGNGVHDGVDVTTHTQTSESIPQDDKIDTWEQTVCGLQHTMAIKIVGSIAYNNDDEPQVWPM